MNSALYQGWVRHRRVAPTTNTFTYAVTYFFLDLAEIPKLFNWALFLTHNRPGLFSFHRSDYFGPKDVPLEQAVRDRIQADTGERPAGPIRLLTQIRYLGHCFNPVSFYYCYDVGGSRVTHILTEINNTPWNERHSYVLRCEEKLGPVMTFGFRKMFHVSPFMGMDMNYAWRFTPPGERLWVNMDNVPLPGGPKIFDATLFLRRRAFDRAAVTWALLSRPWMTFKTVFLIYWQAARLWIKGTPFVPHPVGGKS